MNKTMLTGLVAGIGIAVAGGVAGFTIMNQAPADDAEAAALVEADAAPAQEVAATTTAARPAPAPAPAASTTAAVPAAPAAEECWEEEVVVQADPRDDKAIAGTAAGALIGGALADRLGDDDDLVTAAGAAAGAYLGRRAQKEYQENRTTTVTETRCAPAGSR